MQISLNLSETTIQKLNTLPDIDGFVEEHVSKALKNQVTAKKKLSKWALLAQEIDSNPDLNLAGYSEQIKKDALEVREGFSFPSDD